MTLCKTLHWGPQHGYGIASQVRVKSRQALEIETGTLYPALHRLERERWIAAEWTVSENKQRVRLYRLTPAGKRQLAVERSRWERLTEAIADVLAPPRGREA